MGNINIQGETAVDHFLKGTVRSDALEGASLSGCTIHSSFSGKDISSMTFLNVNAVNANFSGVQGKHSLFSNSDLTGANLRNGQLSDATFTGQLSSLRWANLSGTTMDRAAFDDGVDMEGANLAGASMTEVIFSPRSLPDVAYLASAEKGLETMRAPGDPIALIKLRKELSNMGLGARVRDVTLALRRSEQEQSWDSCRTGSDFGGRAFLDHKYTRRLDACFMFFTRKIALDYTCQFGRRPWRPLGIIALLGLVWTLVLVVWMSVAPRPGVALVFKTRDGKDVTIALKKLVRRAYSRPKRMLAYAKFAAALSLSSVFNLPFKGVEVGRWLRMLSARDYDFKTRGRMRTFTGCLSLLCFYLLALWVLNFFGEPLSW
jgi:hypothetical protein